MVQATKRSLNGKVEEKHHETLSWKYPKGIADESEGKWFEPEVRALVELNISALNILNRALPAIWFPKPPTGTCSFPTQAGISPHELTNREIVDWIQYDEIVGSLPSQLEPQYIPKSWIVCPAESGIQKWCYVENI